MGHGVSIVESAKRKPPFDVNQYVIDESGKQVRFLSDPLYEKYLATPGDMVSEGMIPPEEFQLSAAMLEMKNFTDQLIDLGFIDRLFRTAEYIKRYDVARGKQRILLQLVNCSREHKAAIRRIENAMPENNSGRSTLANYVE